MKWKNPIAHTKLNELLTGWFYFALTFYNILFEQQKQLYIKEKNDPVDLVSRLSEYQPNNL